MISVTIVLSSRTVRYAFGVALLCSAIGIQAMEGSSAKSHSKKRSAEVLENGEFKCESCDYSTPYKQNLTRHRVLMHKLGPIEKFKKHGCSICHFKALTPSHLKSHMATHRKEGGLQVFSFQMAEKLVLCDCGFVAQNLWALSVHKKLEHNQSSKTSTQPREAVLQDGFEKAEDTAVLRAPKRSRKYELLRGLDELEADTRDAQVSSRPASLGSLLAALQQPPAHVSATKKFDALVTAVEEELN